MCPGMNMTTHLVCDTLVSGGSNALGKAGVYGRDADGLQGRHQVVQGLLAQTKDLRIGCEGVVPLERILRDPAH